MPTEWLRYLYKLIKSKQNEVTCLRNILVFGLFAILLSAGCIQTPSGSPPSQPPGAPQQSCRNVTTMTPVTQEQCGNVSYTEPVCALRKLNYSITLKPEVNLCIADGTCSGQPLGQCGGCSNAMSRCIMIIKNNEPLYSGNWTVGANYTLGNTGYSFIKDPITASIDPGTSYEFDFNQIYNPGNPINSADCQLFVIKDPSIQDCRQETRVREDCINVTMNVSSVSEVCG
jgi:hypothetical protein